MEMKRVLKDSLLTLLIEESEDGGEWLVYRGGAEFDINVNPDGSITVTKYKGDLKTRKTFRVELVEGESR